MWQKTKNLYHLGMAIIANARFKFPSRKLTIIGVTGTDGKTTTTSLIYHILHTAGLNASMISSVGAIIGGKNYDVGFHVTTPSSFAIQRFIKKAADLSFRQSALQNDARLSGLNRVSNSTSLSKIRPQTRTRPNFNSPASRLPHSDYLVLETTSHALDQYRVFGIKFDVGVLTNITHEHLDYHKTYENYVKTKAKLFKMAKVAVTNRDDESYALLSSKFKVQSSKLRTYGIKNDADVNPINFPFKTNLIGDYNKYNILAAVSVCKALGIKDEAIRKGIESFVAPLGRGDVIHKKDYTVMIDFAHTPNAIDQILKAVRTNVEGKIIHVFGSAGARDVAKRPLMGKMSSKYADVIILTAEDPRRESVEKINHEIELGIKNYELRIKNKTLLKIKDRTEAIKAAIKMAKKGDFVLMTGKSHEKSMNYGQGEVPWDEYATVKKAISEKK